jgi:iron complex outermembrane receptor protein
VITKEKNKAITSEKDSKALLIRVTKKNDTRSPVTTITSEELTEDDNKTEAKEKVRTVLKEMVVTEEIAKDSHYTSPSTRIKRAQIETQNAQTTEEVLKFQPSLQIRQRYVGDPNGVLGIRGADMFSTARNMVFADGLPIHNHLQGTFNGAPR